MKQFISLYAEVATPIPSVSEISATAVNPGDARNIRIP